MSDFDFDYDALSNVGGGPTFNNPLPEFEAVKGKTSGHISSGAFSRNLNRASRSSQRIEDKDSFVCADGEPTVEVPETEATDVRKKKKRDLHEVARNARMKAIAKKPINKEAGSTFPLIATNGYALEQNKYAIDEDEGAKENAESIIRNALKNTARSTASKTSGISATKETRETPTEEKNASHGSEGSTKTVSSWIINPDTLPALPPLIRKSQAQSSQSTPCQVNRQMSTQTVLRRVDRQMQNCFGDDEVNKNAGLAPTPPERRPATRSKGSSQTTPSLSNTVTMIERRRLEKERRKKGWATAAAREMPEPWRWPSNDPTNVDASVFIDGKIPKGPVVTEVIAGHLGLPRGISDAEFYLVLRKTPDMLEKVGSLLDTVPYRCDHWGKSDAADFLPLKLLYNDVFFMNPLPLEPGEVPPLERILGISKKSSKRDDNNDFVPSDQSVTVGNFVYNFNGERLVGKNRRAVNTMTVSYPTEGINVDVPIDRHTMKAWKFSRKWGVPFDECLPNPGEPDDSTKVLQNLVKWLNQPRNPWAVAKYGKATVHKYTVLCDLVKGRQAEYAQMKEDEAKNVAPMNLFGAALRKRAEKNLEEAQQTATKKYRTEREKFAEAYAEHQACEIEAKKDRLKIDSEKMKRIQAAENRRRKNYARNYQAYAKVEPKDRDVAELLVMQKAYCGVDSETKKEVYFGFSHPPLGEFYPGGPVYEERSKPTPEEIEEYKAEMKKKNESRGSLLDRLALYESCVYGPYGDLHGRIGGVTSMYPGKYPYGNSITRASNKKSSSSVPTAQVVAPRRGLTDEQKRELAERKEKRLQKKYDQQIQKAMEAAKEVAGRAAKVARHRMERLDTKIIVHDGTSLVNHALIEIEKQQESEKRSQQEMQLDDGVEVEKPNELEPEPEPEPHTADITNKRAPSPGIFFNNNNHQDAGADKQVTIVEATSNESTLFEDDFADLYAEITDIHAPLPSSIVNTQAPVPARSNTSNKRPLQVPTEVVNKRVKRTAAVEFFDKAEEGEDTVMADKGADTEDTDDMEDTSPNAAVDSNLRDLYVTAPKPTLNWNLIAAEPDSNDENEPEPDLIAPVAGRSATITAAASGLRVLTGIDIDNVLKGLEGIIGGVKK